jgi:hypothetical protein
MASGDALARLGMTPPMSLGAAAAASRTPTTASITTAEAMARLATTPPVSLGSTPTGSLGAPIPKGPRATGVHDFTTPAVFYVNRF